MNATRMEERERGKNREDGGKTQWKRWVTVNDAKTKTYLNVGDGQVNVSPWKMITPFENKNQLDWESEKILEEERRSRKIHVRGRRGNDRSRPSDTGTGNREGNGKNQSSVFPNKVQTDRQGRSGQWEEAGRDNEELFFCFFSKSGNLGCSISAKKECVMRWWMLQREQTSCFSNMKLDPD